MVWPELSFSYVVCTTRRPPVSWNVSSDPSPSRGPRLEEPQQVFIGIFPGSHVFIREELPDAEGSLADVAAAFQNGRRLAIADGLKPRTPGGPPKNDEKEDLSSIRKSFNLVPLLHTPP